MKLLTQITLATGSATAALLWCAVALAQPSPGQGGQNGEPPPRPPQEAFDACKSLASGASCSFTGMQNTKVQGTCWAPENKPLACKPAQAPGAPAKK